LRFVKRGKNGGKTVFRGLKRVSKVPKRGGFKRGVERFLTGVSNGLTFSGVETLLKLLRGGGEPLKKRVVQGGGGNL